jgi:hypothetical protein
LLDRDEIGVGCVEERFEEMVDEMMGLSMRYCWIIEGVEDKNRTSDGLRYETS